MWYLIFLFSTIMNIMSLIYPFLVKFDVKFNTLKLKGSASIKVFNKIKFEIKFRIKHGYIYFYYKKKEIKEKISKKNINFVFIVTLIKELYFREQVLNIDFKSNFGYLNDSRVTATTSGYVQLISNMILSKIKNNKKLAHILVVVEPKYNEDIFNLRLTYEMRISIVDLIYVFIYAKYYVWRDYEKSGKSRVKQREKN